MLPKKTLILLFVAALAGCGDPPPDSDAALEIVEPILGDAQAAAGPANLDTLLDNWFADYSDGDLAYLDVRGREIRGGDRRLTGTSHRYVRGAAYGPFDRNLLDVWLPLRTRGPTPLAVFVHGGGFENGDRSQVHREDRARRLLEAGYAVASINYRWGYTDPEAALDHGVPNDLGNVHDEDGARLDYILRDCARAIQYLRHRAPDWNLDTTRIGAFGPSAGGGCAMWTATVPDLAQPNHADPVLRQSSRLQAVGHEIGQVSYNWVRWPELLGFDADWLFDTLDGGDIALMQMTQEDQATTVQGRRLSRVLDYYDHLSGDDPPMYTAHGGEDLPQAEVDSHSEIVHHVRGHYALYDRCVAVGGRCEIATRDRDSGYPGDVVDFLIEHLRP